MSFHVPAEAARVRRGPLASSDADGNNGAFWIASPKQRGRMLALVVSDGLGWEHISVHAAEGERTATPTWAEMCFVKDLFWDPEDVVMQLHPRRSKYVNHHPHTLHLWRPTFTAIPEPEPVLVGPPPR